MFFATFGSPNLALADCQASVFLRDWQSGFQSKDKAFDWCFGVASSWGLDLSDGWKKRFCNVNKYYKNNKRYYSSFFWYLDYKYEYEFGYFEGFYGDYANRVHDGHEKRIEIVFSPWCRKYDY